MKRVRRILKWVGLVLLLLFALAQFVRPAKTNPPVDPSIRMEKHVQVSPQVGAILDRSCRDCHSNNTRWPWYSHVAPVSWLLVDDVNKGRSDLNMSEWGRYDNSEAATRLRDMCREARAGVMPLTSYQLIHRSAKLSAEDVKVLCDWANEERARLTSH